MPRSHSRKAASPSLTGFLLSGLATAVGGWILYSAVGINHRMPLPPAINAEQRRFVGRTTRFLSYYVDREAAGRPLVLIHSINAAASAYEMRPIFEQYRVNRPVYALDLPGFGFSERADRVYSIELYTNAILEMLQSQVGEPADVVALSLSCEFAARAAYQHPELFHSLTLISPTGMLSEGLRSPSETASDYGVSGLYHNALTFPLWSQPFFDLLVTRPSIRYFLQMSFVGEVDPGMVEYAYLAAHQPKARFAPLYFVSGKLFSPAIYEEIYGRLTLPVLVLYDQDPYVRFDLLDRLVKERPNWNATRITPTRGLPQFEKMADVAQALDAFWAGL